MVAFGIDLPLVLALVGVGLLILETMMPTEYLLIVGAALLGAGVVGTLIGPAAGPIVLAILTVLFGIVTFYGYREFGPYSASEGGRTKTASDLRGQTGVATERVTGTEGQVKLDDGGFNPYYQARALDEPVEEGEEVLVTDPGGGNVLTVTSRESLQEDEIDRALRRDAAAAGGDRRDGSASGRPAADDGQPAAATDRSAAADDAATAEDAATTAEDDEAPTEDLETERSE